MTFFDNYNNKFLNKMLNNYSDFNFIYLYFYI